MSKEFKNIDELFKTTVGLGSAKAPAGIKTNVLAKIGGSQLWLLGAVLLFITAIGAIFTTLNMAPVNTLALYQPREKVVSTEIDKKTNNAIESNKTQVNITNTYVNSENKNELNHKVEANPTPLKAEQKNPNLSVPNKEKNDFNTKLNRLNQSDDISTNTTDPTPSISADEVSKNETPSVSAPIIDRNLPVNDLPIDVSQADSEDINSLEVPEKEIAEVIEDDSKLAVIDITTNNNNNNNNSDLENSNVIISNTSDTVITNVDGEAIAAVVSDHIVEDSAMADFKIETDPKGKKGYWIIGAQIGPSINNVNYTDSEFSSSLSKYHSEKLGYQGQIYGQYISPSKIVATAGLGLDNQSFNTTFLTTNTNLEISSNSVFSHYIYDDTSNVIIDSVFITDYDTIQKTELENHYGLTRNQYLQIPIRIGYQIEKNKWIFGVDLSAQLNYLLKTSGSYYKDNTVLDLKGSHIFKRTTFSYSAGANLKYNMLNNLYLTGEVRYSPSLHNYYESSYAKRSINAVQLRFGMGLKL